MTTHTQTRRRFLGSAAFAAAAAPAIFNAKPAAADAHAGDAFIYEVTRSQSEWQDFLTPEEFIIMRMGGTEQRFSSDLWNEEGAGTYHCRGCDLPIYSSERKTVLPIGWVFFEHSEPDTVLLGVDEWPSDSYGESGMAESRFVTEAHCRRCGSHLGHILLVLEDVLHCINGTSLVFTSETA